jgi:hypothetical protein
MTLSNVSIEKREKIKKSYLEGVSLKEMSILYNYSENSLRQILYLLKIKRGENKPKWSKKLSELKFPLILKNEKEILSMYNDSKVTIQQLSVKFNIPRRQFNHYFNYHNIPIRKMNRTYDLNENYFNKIDNLEKAYFLGLLYADGWVIEKTGYIGIALVEETPNLLENLNKSIKSSRPIKKYNGKTSIGYYFRLDLNSFELLNDLKNHGISQNKTFSLKFPATVPKELLPHFIRGVYDGDGSGSYKDKPIRDYFGFLGTKEFCIGLQYVLNSELTLSEKVNINKHKNIFSLRYSNKEDIKKLYNYIYKDKNSFYLKRKFDKFHF